MFPQLVRCVGEYVVDLPTRLQTRPGHGGLVEAKIRSIDRDIDRASDIHPDHAQKLVKVWKEGTCSS